MSAPDSDATMAVTKATTALSRAAQTRGRSAEAALAQALRTVDEARELLRQARIAISASASRRRRERVAAAAVGDAAVTGQSEASCPGCGSAFVVRYRAATSALTVAFPVACPAGDCDGVSEVEYPASAVDVAVELLPAP